MFNLNITRGPKNQNHPEFTQPSYIRLRQQEEVFQI